LFTPKSIRKAAVGETLLAEIAQWWALSVDTTADAWVFPSETGSCSSLMNDQGTDGKVVADQLGHTLDVNQNVYTRVAFDREQEAVNKLDSLFRVN
jgi:hypothetical protein